jgi:hypothetical protein
MDLEIGIEGKLEIEEREKAITDFKERYMEYCKKNNLLENLPNTEEELNHVIMGRNFTLEEVKHLADSWDNLLKKVKNDNEELWASCASAFLLAVIPFICFTLGLYFKILTDTFFWYSINMWSVSIGLLFGGKLIKLFRRQK